MKKIRTFVEVFAFPVVAMFAIGFGPFMAVVHLLALPVRYLLEKRLERGPLKPIDSAQSPPSSPGRQGTRLVDKVPAIASQRSTNSGK